MRKGVPFFAEEQFVRGDEPNEARSREGQEINALLSTAQGSSSWEEIVAWPSRAEEDTADPRQVAITNPIPRVSGGKHKMKGESAHPGGETSSRRQVPRARLDWIPIRNGHCLRINVSGNMDLQMRDEWRRMLREMAKNNVGQFEFNLTQTSSLSLSGLGMLLLFREIKKSQRTDIKLCHCNKQIREMLQLTGMDKYFMIQARIGQEEES